MPHQDLLGEGHNPVVICSQLPENGNTSVTNMAEYLAAEAIAEHGLPTPLVWIEHYPEHAGEPGEWSLLVEFSSWQPVEVRLGGVWRYRVGASAVVFFAPRGSRRPNRKTGRTADVAHA